MEIVPVTLAEANTYVERFHRHTGPMPLPCAKFACAAVTDDGAVLGVAIAGHTSARALMDRTTLEVNRVCTDGAMNVCSKLYASILRAGRALGYRRFITYTLTVEGGASLKASGWTQVAQLQARTWNGERHHGTAREDRYFFGARVRWEIVFPPAPPLLWPALPPSPQQSLLALL